MGNSSIKAIILTTVFCSLFSACSTEVNTDMKGKWRYAAWTMGDSDVDIAAMGNPEFDFQKDDIFTVTYGNQSNTEQWHIDGDTLRFSYKDGGSQSYLIEHKGSDTVQLSGKTSNINNQLTLVRKKD